MKVLFINSVCGIGSTGRICTDIAEVLEEKGHLAKIAYGRNSYVPEKCREYGIRVGTDIGVKVHGLISRCFDAHGAGSKNATKKLINMIQEMDPDIIHLHNVHGYYLNIDVLFGFLRKWEKPIVWTLHDCWSLTGHCSYFDYVGCNKWEEGCGKCPQKESYPASLFLDRSAANYLHKKALFSGLGNLTIVTPSQWLADIVKKSYLNTYSVHVINNGIDTNEFRERTTNLREKYDIPENKKILLGVSMGWPPSKRLDYMVRLSEDLDSEYKVVIIGIDEKQKKNIPSNIIAISKTKNVSELAEWYATADVFVNPTMQDNYPTVNLEAQACGTPVVTFDSGGSKECISENYGVAVEPGNYNQLKEAVIRAASLKRRNVYIKNQREFTEEYLALYKALL